MKLKYFFVLFVFYLHLANANQAVDQLRQTLDQTKTFQANFVQTIYSEKKNIISRSKGKMYLQHPGKFRWETKSPTKQTIVVNSDKVWIYDIDLDQVTIKKVSKDVGSSPAALLSGATMDLKKYFNVELLSKTSNLSRYRLSPKSKESSFKSMELLFKKNNHIFALEKFSFFDNLDQETLILFSNVKLNKTIQAKLFIFTPPKGVDVIRDDDNSSNDQSVKKMSS